MVLLCPKCGLYYKDHVPEPTSLSRLFEYSLGEVWDNHYNYKSEVSIAQGLLPETRPGVLDVGSGNGQLLRSFSGFCSRLSALDVVKNPECEKYVNCEFITGWLEEEQLFWSGTPYDFVTMFDIIEHLYDVAKAFVNLGRLVRPGGYVLVETGDAEASLPERYGANNWWFLNRIEHHVAFTNKSLSNIAKMFGFTVILSMRKRHKNVSTFSAFRIAGLLLMSAAYRVYPAGYMKVMNLIFERPIIQPRNPLEDDHMFIILRRDE
jgi:SAM-dependent methyltransferase